MTNGPDITCVGDIMVEHLVYLPSLPPPDTTMVLDSYHQQVGGPAFNVCWHLTQLGHKPRLVGPFGKHDSALMSETFSTAGMASTGLIPVEGDTDRLFAFLIDHNHHSVYFRSTLTEDVGSKIATLCEQPSCLVLFGSRHRIIRELYISLLNNLSGVFVVFNPSYAIYEYSQRELEQLLVKYHVTIVNEQEAEQICKIFGLTDISHLSKLSPGPIIVTLGEKGAKVFHHEFYLEIESFSASRLGLIGAGDAFIAGFIHETLRGALLADAIRFGSHVAAQVVESSKIRVEIREEEIRTKMARLMNS